jgi:dipeptidyl-peptidase-4
VKFSLAGLCAGTSMFSKILYRLPTLTLCAVMIVLTPPALHAATAKPLDMQTIFASDTFTAQLPTAIAWLPHSNSYAFIESDGKGQRIVSRAADSAQTKIALALSDVGGFPANFTLTDFQWQPEHSVILLRGPVTTDWQGYQSAPWYIYQINKKTLRPLGQEGQQLQLVKLSPSGRHAGFVVDNNIYTVDLESGKSKAVTNDGDGDIFNGIFDYGSTEFGPVDGWRWSPDGQQIAFWRMDASEVRLYPLIDELRSYSEVRTFHYPNTSEKHAVNRIGVHALQSGKTDWIDVGHDPDDYLAQMHWNTNSDGLYIQHLSRDHNTLKLWYAVPWQKKVTLVLQDNDPAWIDITNDLQPLADGSVIWTSEKSGYRHIYRVTAGEEGQTLTQGDWSVDSVIGIDKNERWVYFYAKKDSLIDQHVYRVNLADKHVQKLTDKAGWHSWQLSSNADYALATYSDARTPQSLSVVTAAGEQVMPIVAESVAAFDEYAMTQTEFISFDTDDGVSLNGFFIKPPDFDPAKKYPVISYGYGNAGSQVVVNRWGTQRGPTQDLWHRYMAQRGYVIFAMDNRTTTGRGKAAKNLTYGEYGKYAVLDYIQGVNYLKSLPWVDSERIGFWGWSGGGYLAAALMTKAAPLFKVAVSVAPVIDLAHYQAVGVERWMGTPDENPKGYAAVNVMNYADKLQGKLLLIHGTGDENVKFAFTLQFADSLIKAGKQFDMMVYPNQRHGISDFRLHVFSTISRYFEDNL